MQSREARWSWEIQEIVMEKSWRSHRKIFFQVCGNPDIPLHVFSLLGALLFDAAEKGEVHISPLQPYVSMEETVLTSGEIKLEDTGYAVVSGKR